METSAAPPGNALSQQCSSCDDASARCWCVDCGEALCDACVSAHRRVTLTRTHRILNEPPAGGASTPPTKFCRLHPTEPLKLFCLTCSQLTCRDCQLMAHMNHRFDFVSEALDNMKKQLEVWVQPIRAHADRVRRSLLDMELRLQDLEESESSLRSGLQTSLNIMAHRLKKRMETLLQETKAVCEMEREKILRRMKVLQQLQQKQRSVTEAAEKARLSSELSALLAFTTQIQSQLPDLLDQDLCPPQTMSQLYVFTDNKSVENVVSFGRLSVSWVPFSVSQKANRSTPTPPSSAPPAPPAPTCPPPLPRSAPPAAVPPPVQPASPLISFAPPPLPTVVALVPVQTCAPPIVLTSQSLYQVSHMPQVLPPQTLPQTSIRTRNAQQTPAAAPPIPPTAPPSSDRPRPPSTPPTSTCSAPSCTTLPQTRTTTDPPSPVHPSLNSPNSQPESCAPQFPPHPLPPPSSSPAQQSPVVKAVADSACDSDVPPPTARPKEPSENEPTSTVCEEADAPPPPSSLIGQPDSRQPRVSLFRLPVTPPRPGGPLPRFCLVPGDDEDEIYLREMSEDPQSHADDITDDITDDISEPSPPDSPLTLQVVSCSACSSPHASIICSACGRGFHRHCHVPPVGPDLRSEWICSLCQDLSDPSDPYSSDRPHGPPSPGLSVLDQRRCESLLLYLKVEGYSRLSECDSLWSHVIFMSDRVTLHRPSSYQTAAEFLSDVWSLFEDSQDDDALVDLQQRLQSRSVEMFGPELGADGADGGRSEVTQEEQEVTTSRMKMTEMRKRLRDFLGQVGTAESKRTKEETPPLTPQQPITAVSDVSPESE